MKADNQEIGTGNEGVGSIRARIGGDRGGASDTRDDAVRTLEGEIADAELRIRKRADGGGSRGRRASKSRNALGRTGPRNTGRRTSAAEAGSRKGLVATRNRMKKRSGGVTKAKSARGTAASRGRAGARKTAAGASRAGLRTRSRARKAGKTPKR